MAKHTRRRRRTPGRAAPRTLVSLAGLELTRTQVFTTGGVALALSIGVLSTSVGTVDTAMAGPELAAQQLESTTTSSTPLAADWFADQTSTTVPATTSTVAEPPSTTTTAPASTVPPTTSTTAAPPPTTTSTTAPDPMAGLPRYTVQVGSYVGPAWRLSDVEPGRLGRGQVALLVCSCRPEELKVGDSLSIDGRLWQVSRVPPPVSAAGLAELLDGAPVVPVVRIVSSLEGATHAWVEAR